MNLRMGMKTIEVMLLCVAASAQSIAPDPLRYSVTTPRPINPAEGTTNSSAQATQSQNPYPGSVPSRATGVTMDLSLREAIDRGLRYNLGLVESTQGSADARADRLRALAALLPQREARGRQAFEAISYKEIGLKLRPFPAFRPCLRPLADSDIRTRGSILHSPYLTRRYASSIERERAPNKHPY
ncbi:MAG: hypothetical protein ABSB35_22795 [Bryobacteraceae bacterium]|jgi:hypothetical protein